jgi:hypothetical protein
LAVGRSLSNLAALYRDEDRYNEGGPLYQSAVAIDQIARGPDHALICTLNGPSNELATRARPPL